MLSRLKVKIAEVRYINRKQQGVKSVVYLELIQRCKKSAILIRVALRLSILINPKMQYIIVSAELLVALLEVPFILPASKLKAICLILLPFV